MADTQVSKTCAERREGSSPSLATMAVLIRYNGLNPRWINLPSAYSLYVEGETARVFDSKGHLTQIINGVECYKPNEYGPEFEVIKPEVIAP